MDNVRIQNKDIYIQGGTKGTNKDARGSADDVLSKERAPNVELYAERWEQGLNIWTGEPMTDIALTDWKNQQKRQRRKRLS